MTPATFRRLALSFPEAAEGSHMSHPDFRVGGRIFATLTSGDGDAEGVLKLSPREQAEWMAAHPEVFEPVKGGWGRQGYTTVHLKAAKVAVVRRAMEMAWRSVAVKAPGRKGRRKQRSC